MLHKDLNQDMNDLYKNINKTSGFKDPEYEAIIDKSYSARLRLASDRLYAVLVENFGAHGEGIILPENITGLVKELVQYCQQVKMIAEYYNIGARNKMELEDEILVNLKSITTLFASQSKAISDWFFDNSMAEVIGYEKSLPEVGSPVETMNNLIENGKALIAQWEEVHNSIRIESQAEQDARRYLVEKRSAEKKKSLNFD
jgi:hypothetical protein